VNVTLTTEPSSVLKGPYLVLQALMMGADNIELLINMINEAK
jgi:hypothetical protein